MIFLSFMPISANNPPPTTKTRPIIMCLRFSRFIIVTEPIFRLASRSKLNNDFVIFLMSLLIWLLLIAVSNLKSSIGSSLGRGLVNCLRVIFMFSAKGDCPKFKYHS